MRRGTTISRSIEILREVLTTNERVEEERESLGEETLNRGDQIRYRRQRRMTRVRHSGVVTERGLESVKEIGHVVWYLTTDEVVGNIGLTDVEVA